MAGTPGPTNRDFDASQEIWDFFNRFTLNGPASINEAKEKMDILVYPNPSSNDFELQISDYEFVKPLKIFVFDLSGREIMEQKIVRPSTNLNTQTLKSGIYYLKVEGQYFNLTKRIVKQ